MFEYLKLGLWHVLDIGAYDHMLFITIMLVNVSFLEWKKALKLVTCFTLGHSLTLAFVVIWQPFLSSEIVEFLIPITILISAIFSLKQQRDELKSNAFQYAFITFFGLIHGMGFAGYLGALLPTGAEIWWMLLGFNIGIEMAQIIVAFFVLSLLHLISLTTKQTTRIAQTAISVVGILISLFLAAQNFPF
jgi:hypothetical protein